MADNCPCGSGVDYASCCGRFHLGDSFAQTAEQLMRSRYSAFVKQQGQYLLDTWHASTRPASLNLADSPQWVGLQIVGKSLGEADDTEGRVEFVASFLADGKQEQLHENSRFVKEDGRWFYVDGELIQEKAVKVSRNAACPCGSGKKYKRCCGKG